jgi:hypothetical protein
MLVPPQKDAEVLYYRHFGRARKHKNKVKIGRRQNLAIEAAQMSSQRKILC